MEKKKEAFHTALLHDDFSCAGKILEELKEENDFKLLRHLYQNVSTKQPLLTAFTGELPTTIAISPSHTCNLRCKFCISGFHNKTRLSENESYLSLKEFKRLQPWFRKVKTISFCGIGETLDTPDLFHFIEFIEKKVPQEVTVEVVTSGVSLTMKHIQKFIKSGLRTLTFSIDSPTPIGHGGGSTTYQTKAYQKVQQVQDEKKRLNSKYPNIFINTVLTKDNIKNLPEHIKKVEALGTHTLQLALMSPATPDLYEKSLFPTLSISLDQVRRIVQQWEASPMRIHIEIPCKPKPFCWFISEFASFYRDIQYPSLCCSALSLPHKVSGGYTIEQYWNSFPMRVLRYCHSKESKGSMPIQCTECIILNIQAFAESRKRQLMHSEDDLYDGYAEGVGLKNKGKNEEAKALLKKTLAKRGSHATRGRIYLHLCEIALMEEKYDEAMEHIQKTVYYQFNHRKAFSYLYLLAMLTGKEPQLQGQ